jgi:hypothetical protein
MEGLSRLVIPVDRQMAITLMPSAAYFIAANFP